MPFGGAGSYFFNRVRLKNPDFPLFSVLEDALLKGIFKHGGFLSASDPDKYQDPMLIY